MLTLCPAPPVQELDRFKKAMDDPTFRNLLQEYTNELSDPRARAEQEAYLREVEERAASDPDAANGDYSGVPGGMAIPKGSKLISPTPVFCVKMIIEAGAKRTKPKSSAAAQGPAASTQSPTTTAPSKIFVNMCTCDAMNDVSSEKVEGSSKGGKKAGASSGPGVQISLPYSLSDPRPFTDTSGHPAKVYDFIFSSSTWAQYQSQLRYVTLFEEMAIEAVEDREGVVHGSIDKSKTLVLKNTTFKGGKPPPRLFKIPAQQQMKKEEKQAKTATPSTAESNKRKTNEKEAEEKTQPSASASAGMKQVSTKKLAPTASAPPKDPRTPVHHLVHRGFYDFSRSGTLGNLSGGQDSSKLAELASSRPAELVLKITLPLLERVSDVNLDQAPTQILLSSAQYYLLFPLPFPVLSDQGRAGWSSKTKTLTVTMVVAPPSAEEIEKYMAQRQGFDQAQRSKALQEQAQAAEEERIEREAKEEAAREEHARKQAEIDATTAATAAAAAASSTPAATAASAASTPAAGAPSASSETSPKSSGSPKRVRFSLSAEDGFIVPERDGPHGPKPVGKIVELAPPPPEKKGHGHKKKHVPGTEGPEAWTGIGREPSKAIREAFPSETVATPLSPTAVPASPKSGVLHAPPAQSQRLWAPYTYNQSEVGVQLIVKVKGIIPDSVQLHMEDAVSSSAASSDEVRTRVDLYFSTRDRRHYRLFLPLSHAINIAKSNSACTPANLLINLIKVPFAAAPAANTGEATTSPTASTAKANEWDHLLDYSVLGDFDAEGTPLSSPAPSPKPGSVAAMHAGIEELELGTTAQAHEAQQAAAAAAAEKDASKPAVVALQALPSVDSAMINPFVTSTKTATTTAPASTTAFAPSNSLLFQLD